jgi:hypothetical protein
MRERRERRWFARAAAQALADDGGGKDCRDFAAQAEAQAWFAAHGGGAARNVANLDHNRHGIAGEASPYEQRQRVARAARRGGAPLGGAAGALAGPGGAVAWGRARARRGGRPRREGAGMPADRAPGGPGAPLEPEDLRPPAPAAGAPAAGGGRPVLTAVASLAVVGWLGLALALAAAVVAARGLGPVPRFALAAALVGSVGAASAWPWSRPWRR